MGGSKAYSYGACSRFEVIVVDVFAEDYAHEEFVGRMVQRLGEESGKALRIRSISARGGHPRVLSELKSYLENLTAGLLVEQPDVIVAAIDTNCAPYGRTRKQVSEVLGELTEKAIIACPNPHVERWYMADPESFHAVIGSQPSLGKRKCDRAKYKAMLNKAVTSAGHPATLGGIEFAPELVAAMDLYRAGKNEKSLKHFVDDARSVLPRLTL